MKRTPLFFPLGLALVAMSFAGCKKDEVSLQPLPTAKTAAIAGNVNLAAVSLTGWMTQLSDNLSVSAISIPGTHDSGARFEPIGGTAKCQNLTIAEQLNAGVRFLDIRCRHIDNAFAIHHGSIYQNMNFDDVLNAVISFLNSNPGETVIMSVKEEYDASNTSRSFEATFDTYVQKNPSKWYLDATIPTLGQVRGKIVLLRRFGAAATPKGIAATNWADNTTFSISNPGANLRVQDQYQVPDNNVKWTNLNNLFTEAKNGDQSVLYVNFASGYKPLIFGIPSITSVSDNINPKLDTYFGTSSHARYGVIPMDFVTADRATKILNTNF
ncbi:1-phosphatidylinositol phosphodiesterase [Chitinophaga dinghuensis]|uniref:1-phosphatidylinositol phosphodiesterase n=1 Tax=Chitinophaga dinghuensis TaxID=1539050 RepID=A0A327W0J6_9BACT|nr:phosphatidylinositol-specific phospholipase C [Chitinophaga dinghuensis]RAJ81900.1 1-phosphatidylinositol phosphodiesterase [Chitinophaga dinghuensis]